MIVCAGSAMIDCIITGNDADVAEDIALSPGGEAFNEASALAVLGNEVYLNAAVGKDHAGNILRIAAREAGFRIMPESYAGRTPVSLLAVDETGNRKSRVSRVHALTGFSPSVPADCRISFVTMGSLFRPPFLDPEVCVRFASAAKAAGARLLMDTKLPKGTSPVLKEYADTLALADYLTPNETESEYYTGCSDPAEAAAVFHSFGVRNVIIKMSERGCYISPEDGADFRLPAFPAEVVDGIGAGDTFAAGLIHRLVRGDKLRDAAVFASACASVSLTGRGAVSALHSEAQVLEYLQKQQLSGIVLPAAGPG